MSSSSFLLGIFSPAGLPGTALLEAGLLLVKTYFLYYLSPQNLHSSQFAMANQHSHALPARGGWFAVTEPRCGAADGEQGLGFFHPWAAYLLSVTLWQAKLAVRCWAPTRCPH